MDNVAVAGQQSVEDRIVDAALALVARHGVARTLLADVAREARCGRATVYRAFPGGKAQVLRAVGQREVSRLYGLVAGRLDAAATLEDALVVAVTESARFFADHRALRFVLAHEPGVVLPYLGFGRVDRVYRAAGALAGPHLARFVGGDQASWAVEWVARLLVSYILTPETGVDLINEADARQLVATYLIPGLAPVGPSMGAGVSSTGSPFPSLTGAEHVHEQ